MKCFLIVFLLWSQHAAAQLSKVDSLWLPFRHFIGSWKGTGEGVDGKGDYERTYQFALNKKYIEVRNKSVYPPSEKNSTGYVHEDIGMISYDKIRKTFVFRQFHSEGFVNQYVLESISVDGTTLVFVTESIENIPPGWKARETYVVREGSELSEAFDLAEPGKVFEPYTRARFTKSN